MGHRRSLHRRKRSTRSRLRQTRPKPLSKIQRLQKTNTNNPKIKRPLQRMDTRHQHRRTNTLQLRLLRQTNRTQPTRKRRTPRRQKITMEPRNTHSNKRPRSNKIHPKTIPPRLGNLKQKTKTKTKTKNKKQKPRQPRRGFFHTQNHPLPTSPKSRSLTHIQTNIRRRQTLSKC